MSSVSDYYTKMYKGLYVSDDTALSLSQHQTGDIHYIGEALPSPSSVSSLASAGSSSSVGVSPIAAREDHVHLPMTPYSCRVLDNDGQTITHNTNTGIAFDFEISDVYGMHAPGSGDIVAPVAGWYSCSFTGIVWVATGGVWAYWMEVDGLGGERYGQIQIKNDATFAQQLAGCESIFLAAGSTLSLWAFQTSSGPVAMPAGCKLQAVLQYPSVS